MFSTRQIFTSAVIYFISSHYFVHGGFFKNDGQLLDEVDKIRHIPCTIVQGRYDMVCPAETAWKLHRVIFYFHV